MKTCECGCGATVRLRRGVPNRFLTGHNGRGIPSHPNRQAAITRHGMWHTREYQKYAQAKQRCTNAKCKRYDEYGGRGIEFRFTSFEQFFALLGKCPSDKTLDRIDNDGHYEIGNVRWATAGQQYASRRPSNWRNK